MYRWALSHLWDDVCLFTVTLECMNVCTMLIYLTKSQAVPHSSYLRNSVVQMTMPLASNDADTTTGIIRSKVM